MNSWKTTTSGLVSALMSFILFSEAMKMIVWPQWVLAVALFALVGGLAVFGITAKDYNVSGGKLPPAVQGSAQDRPKA